MHSINDIYGFWNVYTHADSDISDSLNVFSKYLVNSPELPLTILSSRITTRIGGHDPKFLVNNPKFPLTYLSSTRIINYRKSISTNESSITNESSPRLSKVGIPFSFDQVTQLLAMTPSSGNMGHPSSGNYDLTLVTNQFTPTVEIRRRHMTQLKDRIVYKGHSIIPVYSFRS